MTDDLGDFSQWRDSIEERVGTLSKTVEREAGLRAAMDEELSKLHVERDLLQALHDTQQDHNSRLTQVEDRLTKVEHKLEVVNVGVQTIIGMLSGNN
jgi:tetrahydromethanopterin S-methyltransferase subunit G